MHIMKLKEQYFNYIKFGTKTYEIRLNDEKRQKIKIGDYIEFQKEPLKEEKIIYKVDDLLYFKNFEELINKIDITLLASSKETKEELLKTLNSFYNAEEQKKYGNIITLSGSMFIMTDPEVIYLAGGNYEEFMHYNSQYLIQWEMIKYAMEHDYKRYNFYGIPSTFDKNDKDYGIYEFKTRFNGYVEQLIGEYAKPLSKEYYLINLIHKLKK